MFTAGVNGHRTAVPLREAVAGELRGDTSFRLREHGGAFEVTSVALVPPTTSLMRPA
ncbi:MAG: hypothetical protein OXF02_00820 [Simkaniaceae bacterium]|nr:hypothetical protein [Simkaniaceae bacterium]